MVIILQTHTYRRKNRSVASNRNNCCSIEFFIHLFILPMIVSEDILVRVLKQPRYVNSHYFPLRTVISFDEILDDVLQCFESYVVISVLILFFRSSLRLGLFLYIVSSTYPPKEINQMLSDLAS